MEKTGTPPEPPHGTQGRHPKKLKLNPDNPRRTKASPEADAALAANIKAIGLIQPPFVRELDGKLVVKGGERRVKASIAAGLAEIHVIVASGEDEADPLRSLAENVQRAQMGPVDQRRAIEALCGGVIIGGSGNVMIGGGTVTKAPIKSEISPWARRAALLLSLAPGGFGLARALGPALRGIAEDGFLATAKAGVVSLGRAMEERAGGARIPTESEDTTAPEATPKTPRPFRDEPEVPSEAKVSIEDFKPHRPDGLDVEQMDIDDLPPEDAAMADRLQASGWDENTQKQILNSGDGFRSADYQAGDNMYGFSSQGWPKGANSPYWMDEPTFQDMQTRFQDPVTGEWDSPGIKNQLALPCYNQANAVYRGQLTENQSIVISTINPATENVIYKGADGTVLNNFQRSMTGGGTQFAPALNTVGNIAEHGTP